MKAERKRLARLRKLERLREMARQSALTEAASAESTLAQISALADRSRRIAEDYTRRDDAATAADLARTLRFAAGMQHVIRSADAEAANARGTADRAARNVAEAERRRAAAQDRADRAARDIARREYGATLSLGARKGNWHGS